MANYVVTGAGGSIGSQLCAKLVSQNVEGIVLVSLTESGLYNVERKLRAIRSKTKITGVLGSVCDLDLMIDVCEGADVVIHAAAHKHVPICEANPLAAIENNVRGTIKAAQAAEIARVGQFLLISTDKAVHPKSVMGATKRVAEMFVAGEISDTIFTTVRFGNVLDSAGSVLPLWREQITKGGPITLTDERCERYFMSIPQACELILGALRMRRPGTFVFDMGKPRKMVDLAKQLIHDSGKDCEIKITGLRPGEKLTEELYADSDLDRTSHPEIFEVRGWARSTQIVLLQDLLSASKCNKPKLAVELLMEMTC